MAHFASNAELMSPDPVADVFEPDCILPSQFLVPDESGLQGGERKLMAAILADGVEAYISSYTASHRSPSYATYDVRVDSYRRSDAEEWVETIDDGYIFSFDNVCVSLGINPHYLRLGLSRFVETTRRSYERNVTPGGTTIINVAPVWKKIRRPRKS